MNDYICVQFKANPASEDINDLLSSYLADVGFESFVSEGDALLAYCRSDIYNREAVEDILKEFPIPATITFNQELIEGKDWNEEWEKNYFQPIVIGSKCVVHSTFHTDYPLCDYEIVIDPRMAFGTGHHSTTSMMISHLLEQELKGKIVTDMGTGTGILAILAKKCGASQANGIEIDPMAHANAVENAALNEIEINLINGDASSLKELEKADIFLANINRNVILADLELYVEASKPDGKIILSGFFTTDIPIIEEEAKELGMKIALVKSDNDWASIILEREV